MFVKLVVLIVNVISGVRVAVARVADLWQETLYHRDSSVLNGYYLMFEESQTTRESSPTFSCVPGGGGGGASCGTICTCTGMRTSPLGTGSCAAASVADGCGGRADSSSVSSWRSRDLERDLVGSRLQVYAGDKVVSQVIA